MSRISLFLVIPILLLSSLSYSGPMTNRNLVSLCLAHYNINNFAVAKRWCGLAADRGHIASQEILDTINSNDNMDTPLKVDDVEAVSQVCVAHYENLDLKESLEWCTLGETLGDKYSAWIIKNLTGNKNSN